MYTFDFTNNLIASISFGIPSNSSTNSTMTITPNKDCTFEYRFYNSSGTLATQSLTAGETTTITGIYNMIMGIVY